MRIKISKDVDEWIEHGSCLYGKKKYYSMHIIDSSGCDCGFLRHLKKKRIKVISLNFIIYVHFFHPNWLYIVGKGSNKPYNYSRNSN